MSEDSKSEAQGEETRSVGEDSSGSTWTMVLLFWTYVTIPLLWGVYNTSTGVVDLFTGG